MVIVRKYWVSVWYIRAKRGVADMGVLRDEGMKSWVIVVCWWCLIIENVVAIREYVDTPNSPEPEC